MPPEAGPHDFDVVEAFQAAREARQQALESLRQSCYEDGLLARGRLGNEYITKDGRNYLKLLATVDPAVAEAVQRALREPLLRRMRAFVSAILLARERGY